MSKDIIEIDNVRIRRHDARNLVVERLETNIAPKTGQESTGWRLKGYASTIRGAMTLIVQTGLLVDEDKVSDMKSYLEQIAQANEKVLEAIQGLKAEVAL